MNIDIIENFEFYGFAFGVSLDAINFEEIYENLFLKHIPFEDVIFSTYDSLIYEAMFVVAGSRYITEGEIGKIIDFIIENNLEDEYLLIIF